jgi:riboflavin biosynthesis pyrimidine reductase
MERPQEADLEPIQPLFVAADDGTPTRGAPMPAQLEQLNGGPLALPLRADRPTIVVNFVTSLDGVVALRRGGPTAVGDISGGSAADRFRMGLLRTLADVVMVGAGTVRSARGHDWSFGRIAPAQAEPMAEWRASLGLAPEPTTLIVTAHGDVDPNHSALRRADLPVIIAAPTAAAEHLTGLSFAEHVRIERMGTGPAVQPRALADLVRRLGARIVVCEGGPHLFGHLLGADLVDELFLSLAPQLAGRDVEWPRVSLVEERAFAKAEAPWGQLSSVDRAGQLLLLRYRLHQAQAH